MINTGLTNDLTEADIAGCIGTDHDEASHLKNRLARQLLSSMRREANLRDALTIIDMQALNVMQDDVGPYGATLKCGWVHEKCKEALSSEYSGVDAKKD